jgi:hypothetical protein
MCTFILLCTKETFSEWTPQYVSTHDIKRANWVILVSSSEQKQFMAQINIWNMNYV